MTVRKNKYLEIRVYDVPGDGSCFLWAVCLGLAAKGEYWRPAALRKELKKHAEELHRTKTAWFMELVIGPHETATDGGKMAFGRYIKTLAGETTWLGCTEIPLVMDRFNIEVHVIQEGWHQFDELRSSPVLLPEEKAICPAAAVPGARHHVYLGFISKMGRGVSLKAPVANHWVYMQVDERRPAIHISTAQEAWAAYFVWVFFAEFKNRQLLELLMNRTDYKHARSDYEERKEKRRRRR